MDSRPIPQRTWVHDATGLTIGVATLTQFIDDAKRIDDTHLAIVFHIVTLNRIQKRQNRLGRDQWQSLTWLLRRGSLVDDDLASNT